MAERMKDEQDRRLEALFRAPATDGIVDDGFSDRVVRRIRRRVRVRRWTLPIAAAIGGLIAAKPAMDLLALLPLVAGLVPQELKAIPADLLQLPALSSFSLSGFVMAGVLTLAIRLAAD